MVEGNNLAEAWEKSLVSAYANGFEIKTEYDKPDDPPSKDCTMTIVVRDPLAEPMIHKDLPGGLDDLQEYVMEVLDGIKDHCIRDPYPPGPGDHLEGLGGQLLLRPRVPAEHLVQIAAG
jgi:thymidylate synthase